RAAIRHGHSREPAASRRARPSAVARRLARAAAARAVHDREHPRLDAPLVPRARRAQQEDGQSDRAARRAQRVASVPWVRDARRAPAPGGAHARGAADLGIAPSPAGPTAAQLLFFLFVLLFFRLFFFDGTLSPSARASDKPIAIACLRLVTFWPDRPLRN